MNIIDLKSVAMLTRIIIPILIFALWTGCTTKEHLFFKNVPIDGRSDKFARELTKLGFILSDSTKKNEIILSGNFMSKDCKIHVFGTSSNLLVYKIIVSFPEEVRDSVQSDFGKMQKLYTLKYGAGYSKFQQYKKRERLVYKIPAREIMVGDYTTYFTDLGDIIVEVQDGYISITYLDKLNYELWKREFEQKQKPNGKKTE